VDDTIEIPDPAAGHPLTVLADGGGRPVVPEGSGGGAIRTPPGENFRRIFGGFDLPGGVAEATVNAVTCGDW
jgi:hypothetical protein